MGLRGLIALVAVWTVGLIAVGVWWADSHHSRHSKATATSTTMTVTSPAAPPTTTGSVAAGPPPGVVVQQSKPTGKPVAAKRRAQPRKSSTADLTDSQLRLRLATSGYASVARLPFSQGDVHADFSAFVGSQVVLTVDYRGRAEAARSAVDRFLLGNGDQLSSYRLRLVPEKQMARQQKTATVVQLALRGYRLLPYLPYRGKRIEIAYAGERGATVDLVVRYRGTRLSARRAFASLLRGARDSATHYHVTYAKA